MKKILLILISVMLICSFSLSFAGTASQKVLSFNARTVTKNYVVLQWDKADKAKYYEVSYKKASANTYSKKTTTKTSVKISGLKANTTYEFRVRFSDGNNWSKYNSIYRTTPKK